MDRRNEPVLVVFDLDLSKSSYNDLREKLNELGVANTHQLCRNATLKTIDKVMLTEVWPCRNCEDAFLNNILPLMEAMGVRVRYTIYPIRSSVEACFNVPHPQTRWTLCN